MLNSSRSTSSDSSRTPQEGDVRPLTSQEFEAFRRLIHRRAGIALGDAKHALVNSRLRKRLLHLRLTTFTAYLQHLESLHEDDPEFEHLTNCITTNKTDFFREPHHFEFMEHEFIPQAIRQWERGQAPKKLRIWHAGCSTGEEPYSMSMVLSDGFEGKGAWDVKQLASDIDTKVLAFAERAVYENEKAEQIPLRYRQKFVEYGRGANEGHCRIVQRIRQYVKFRQMNLHDPWPIRSDVLFDVIFCRNVMIYFDKPTQKKLLERFATRLKPGGYLLLGHSENTLGLTERFVPIGKTIYRLPERGEVAA